MSLGGGSGSIFLSAANISWGRRECYSYDFSGVTAVSLDGTSFTIEVPGSDFGASLQFQPYFDLDGASVVPTPSPGHTLIEVDITTGDSEAVMAAALAAALEANANFKGESSGSVAVATAQFKGEVGNDSADVDSGLAISQLVDGLGGDLGLTSGGLELSTETQSVVITADQSGQLPREEVFTGFTAEVTTSLLEFTPERRELILAVTGGTFTPSGGTKLVGAGSGALYRSFFEQGGELVAHPSRLPASDKSYDVTFPKCVPKLNSLNFSGEEPQLAEITFTALVDNSIDSAIDYFHFGDSSQDRS